ncbi:MAG TPA: zinc-dependent alcohol dehydrogenase family protein [Gammaproteobacteria bacterium]|jgi:NADPH2:quinone reductase|nr:zinc-dependent alcohol dehydrogenase family protein [Gammaproteobacteria bacterium]
MKAQIITQFGDPSVFTMKDIPKPEIKPGHVLINVAASSVNQIDCKIRSGVVADIAPAFPAILHGDVAGIVDAVASDVTNFKVGDEVYGCAGGLLGTGGALAEYMLADSNLISKKPASLTMTQAAALPLASITAWEALFNRANLKAGQSVLIHGGAGGVGHIAVQLAKWRGAKVNATVLKNEDFPLVKLFGADEVINAKTEDVAAYVKRLTNEVGFDVVFDTVGGPNLDKSFQAAALNGIVVTTAARSSNDLSPMHNKGLTLHVVFMLLPLLKNIGRAEHGKILTELAAIVDSGKCTPYIDPNHFTLETVSDAHRLLESGKAQGKVVLNFKS